LRVYTGTSAANMLPSARQALVDSPPDGHHLGSDLDRGVLLLSAATAQVQR